MQQEFISNFNQYGKTIVNSAKEFAAINSRLATRVLENQIVLANFFVDSSEKQLNLTKGVSSPAEYANRQAALLAALLKELTVKIADTAQTSVKIAQETNTELKAWFENGIKKTDSAVKETKVAVTRTTVARPALVAKKAAPKAKTVKKTAARTPAKTATAKSGATVEKAVVAEKPAVEAKKTEAPKAVAPARAKPVAKAKNTTADR